MELSTIKKILRKAIQELEIEIIAENPDISNEELKEILSIAKEKLLIEMGIDPQEFLEYEQTLKEIGKEKRKKKKEELNKMLADLEERVVSKIPPEKEIPAPQIINKTEIVKEIIKEKPQIVRTEVRTKVIEKELDRTELDEIGQDIRTLQESYQELWDRVRQIKIPDDYVSKSVLEPSIKEYIAPELNRILRSFQSQIYATNKKVDDISPVDLSGFVPYTGATSAVDLGSQNFTTTGIGIFGSIKTPFIYPSSDSTTAFQIRKANGTTSVLNVDTTNSRIGIGATAPTAPLTFGSSTGEKIEFYYGGGYIIGIESNEFRFALGNDAGSMTFRVGAFAYNTPSTERMRLTTTGLGIGTTSPREKLDVSGNITTNWTDDGRFIGMQYQTGTQYRLGMMLFGTPRETRIVSQSNDGINKSAITFYTGATPSERMRITKDGYVGIGTTAPTQKLTVVGTGITPESSSSGASADAMLSVQGNGAAFIMGRDVVNDIEFMMGVSATEGNPFVGSITNHRLSLRTNSTTQWSISTAGHLLSGLDGTSSKNITTAGNGSFGKIGIGTSAGATIPLTFAATTGQKFDLYAGGGYSFGVESNEFRFALGSGAGVMTFRIGSNAYNTASTEKMRLTANGYLGVGTTNPVTTLHAVGAMLITGTYGSGYTEGNLGAGTRLLWYPRKSAFRAGTVSGTQWNDANIGNYSFAVGYNTMASGSYSSAFGQATIASGAFSLSGGDNTIALGQSTVAFGNYSRAYGTASIAIGHYGFAYGKGSFVGGYNANNSLNYLVAGTGIIDEYEGQFAFGYASSGKTLKAEGRGSIAMGQDVNALNANIGTGEVVSVSIDNGGSGYYSSLEITGHNLSSNGYNYQVGDTLTVNGGNNDATIYVDEIDGSGGIISYTLTNAGTGYSTGTYSLSGGSGNNAQIYVSAVKETVDLTILSGDNNAVIECYVDNVNGYVSYIVQVKNGGTGYSEGTGYSTSGGGNNDCVVSITDIYDLSNGNVIVFGRDFSENTRDSFNVGFGSRQLQITSSKVNISTLPTGTLASPPSGLNSGDLWLDTTDSSSHPIVRCKA